jgi:hypothetical protein
MHVYLFRKTFDPQAQILIIIIRTDWDLLVYGLKYCDINKRGIETNNLIFRFWTLVRLSNLTNLMNF